MAHTTARRRITRVTIGESGTTRATRPDTLAVEEPLQILVSGDPYATTMRTPGHDLELALGFLVSEGVIGQPGDITSAAHCSNTSRLTGTDGQRSQLGPAGVEDVDHNTVTVDLAPVLPGSLRRPLAVKPVRHRHVTSACGVCGTETIDAIRERSRYDLRADTTIVDAARVTGLPQAMRSAQKVFDRTGGLHAAGLFDTGGRLLCLREDVGRHNAVDKVVGWAFTRGLLPLAGHVVQVSGRASFELVQKAWLAGVPVLAAVSAPSSLAADLADDAGMTLIGFSRDHHFTIYTGDQRIRD